MREMKSPKKGSLGTDSLDFLNLLIDLEENFQAQASIWTNQLLENALVLVKDFLGASTFITLSISPERALTIINQSGSVVFSDRQLNELFMKLSSISHHQEFHFLKQDRYHITALELTKQDLVIGFFLLFDCTHPEMQSRDFLRLSKMLSRYIAKGILLKTPAPAELQKHHQLNSYAQLSHQLKTPLIGMSHALDLLKKSALSFEQSEYQHVAELSVNTMLQTIDRLLTVAKVESYQNIDQSVVIDVEDEMMGILKIENECARKKNLRLSLEVLTSPGLKVKIDGILLNQAIINLVNNAIKYTNEGSVVLRVSSTTKSRNDIGLLFEIVDTGSGIDSSHIEQITKPYFRVKNVMTEAIEGSGIGLTIVQNILSAFGSQLKVKSSLGQGSSFSFEIKASLVSEDSKLVNMTSLPTTVTIYREAEYDLEDLTNRLHRMGISYEIMELDNFKLDGSNDVIFAGHSSSLAPKLKSSTSLIQKRIMHYRNNCDIEPPLDYIPLLGALMTRDQWVRILSNQKEATSHPPERVAVSHQVLKPWKVLVIDDNPINIKTLQQLLILNGLDVTTANDAMTGIRYASHYDFDFILLDIKMPDMSGPEVLNIIRLMHHPNARIPIFAATAYAFEEERKEYLSIGFDEVVTKPVNISRLINLMVAYKSEISDANIPKLSGQDSQVLFNVEEFNYHYQGLDSLKKEVISLFIEQSESSLRRIQLAILKEDLKRVADEAHYYKGSCSYLSAPRITWLCTQMIEKARNEQKENLPMLMSQLIHETTLFNYEIRDFMNQQNN